MRFPGRTIPWDTRSSNHSPYSRNKPDKFVLGPLDHIPVARDRHLWNQEEYESSGQRARDHETGKASLVSQRSIGRNGRSYEPVGMKMNL